MPRTRNLFSLTAFFMISMNLSAASDSLLGRGLAEAQQGDCRAALVNLKQAVLRNPRSAAAFNAIGVCETVSGHLEDAGQSFETVVKLQPQVWQGWNNLGGDYLALNRLDAAVEAFRKAIALNPNAPAAWVNLGSSLARLDHKLEAFHAYDRAQQLDPKDEQITKTWLSLAGIIAAEAGGLIDKKQYKAAASMLAEVCRPLEHSASWNNLIGYAEFKLNESEHAQQHLEAALRMDPMNEDYLLDVGEFLSAHHAYDEATRFFQVGAERMPSSIRIRFALAISELLENRRHEATAALEELHSNAPQLEYVSRALGECYEASENWAAMIALGKSIENANPSDAVGWYLEGTGLERLSIRDDKPRGPAIRALERAASLDPSSSRYHFQLGKAYGEAKDFTDAARELKKTIHLDPDHERAHYVLAMVYKKTGQTALADKEFQAHRKIKTKSEQDSYAAMLAMTHRAETSSQGHNE